MLGKLLKHEWKSIWKIPTILVIALQIIAVLAGATFAYPFWYSRLNGLDLMMVIVWMIFYFAIIGVSMGVSLYLAVHFYKNMYTDEGYLTHTLPVTPRQLLISRILPMAAWNYLMMLAVLLSLAIFGSMAIVFLNPYDRGLFGSIAYLLKEMEQEGVFGNGSLGFVLSLGLMLLVSGLSGVMMLVGSISVGQLVSKHKILGSIGAYFAINMVIQVVSSIVMVPIMIRSVTNDISSSVFELLTPTYLTATLISAVFAVGMYFISEFIVCRKLNLD